MHPRTIGPYLPTQRRLATNAFGRADDVIVVDNAVVKMEVAMLAEPNQVVLAGLIEEEDELIRLKGGVGDTASGAVVRCV